MFFYVLVVFYTQSLVLMLQYHILTIKHSTVPLFIRYVLLCVFVLYTQSLVLMLQYHILTTKHSTVPLFIRYVLLCVFVFYTQSLALMLQYHISTTKHSSIPVFILHVILSDCLILHTSTCTNDTISHINNQSFIGSRVYTVCYFMCLFYFTHNHLYQCYNIT